MSATSDSDRVTCSVCPHHCHIAPGHLGICGARCNESGTIVGANYGRALALALDPIEKKPLSHFHPGSTVLSYGSYGCNLSCAFCQNSDISMADACSDIAERAVYVSPQQLVDKAQSLVELGNIGVAFTYNEPLVAPEYLRDVATLLHESSLKSIVVTNGYCAPPVFDALLPCIDAVNIDLKCFTEEGYRAIGAPGGLAVVKDNIVRAVAAGVHVEVTTLIVPGLSDNRERFIEECDWLRSINPHIVLHLSRFFPQFRMTDAAPTDLGLLHEFADIARARLSYVELGNI